ncbi:MAG: hypothetical protein ACI9K4_000143, partial [Polaribacter sp.]
FTEVKKSFFWLLFFSNQIETKKTSFLIKY